MKVQIRMFIVLILLACCKSNSQTTANQSIDELEREIVNTWIKDDNANYKLVFSSDMKVKIYLNDDLLSTETYAITSICDGELQSSSFFLKITSEDSSSTCDYIENINFQNNGKMALMTKGQGKIVVFNKL